MEWCHFFRVRARMHHLYSDVFPNLMHLQAVAVELLESDRKRTKSSAYNETLCICPALSFRTQTNFHSHPVATRGIAAKNSPDAPTFTGPRWWKLIDMLLFSLMCHSAEVRFVLIYFNTRNENLISPLLFFCVTLWKLSHYWHLVVKPLVWTFVYGSGSMKDKHNPSGASELMQKYGRS